MPLHKRSRSRSRDRKSSKRYEKDNKTVKRRLSRWGERNYAKNHISPSKEKTTVDLDEAARTMLLAEINTESKIKQQEKVKSYARASGICIAFLKGKCGFGDGSLIEQQKISFVCKV